MKKDKAMKLVKALRSGEYKQGKGQLVDDDDNFCCLGVACNISEQALRWEKRSSEEWFIGGSSKTLPTEIKAEYGFKHWAGWFIGFSIDYDGETHYSLTSLNDAGAPFSFIADVIENNWERL